MSKQYRTFICGGDMTERPRPCPNGGPDHTPAPSGYTDFFEWCDKMAKTHRQRRCEHCGLFGIWELKPPKLSKAKSASS